MADPLVEPNGPSSEDRPENARPSRCVRRSSMLREHATMLAARRTQPTRSTVRDAAW